MKRVVQTYKPPGSWQKSPPGIGDFIRGLCHLYELGQQMGFEVRVDVSQTEYGRLIEQAPTLFVSGDPQRIQDALEFQDSTMGMGIRLDEFVLSDEPEFYLCSNLGNWNRKSLPEDVQRFARPFFDFKPEVSARADLGLDRYCVLSIRCGDSFFGSTKTLEGRSRGHISKIIETSIVPKISTPIVVMSDSQVLKMDLAKQYRFIPSSNSAEHGAQGGAFAVARDLDFLAHSTTNFHINAWAPWWSGFSHYTSLVLGIPSINFYRENFKQRLRRYLIN